MAEPRITVIWLRSALWISVSSWFVLLFVSLLFVIPFHYQRKEPFFINPVKLDGEKFKIRNDTMGKGHFGANRGKNNERRHEGIDILAALGTEILAAKTGRVSFAASHRGYGEYVQIRHPDGSETRYAHLSKILVSRGDWIEKGTAVGLVGKTGNADHPRIRPHLHFEVRRNNRPLNPLSLMDKEGKLL